MALSFRLGQCPGGAPSSWETCDEQSAPSPGFVIRTEKAPQVRSLLATLLPVCSPHSSSTRFLFSFRPSSPLSLPPCLPFNQKPCLDSSRDPPGRVACAPTEGQEKALQKHTRACLGSSRPQFCSQHRTAVGCGFVSREVASQVGTVHGRPAARLRATGRSVVPRCLSPLLATSPDTPIVRRPQAVPRSARSSQGHPSVVG